MGEGGGRWGKDRGQWDEQGDSNVGGDVLS